MKLLPVYMYENLIIYKFVYRISNTGYLWNTRNNLIKLTTPKIDGSKFKRVLRKDI